MYIIIRTFSRESRRISHYFHKLPQNSKKPAPTAWKPLFMRVSEVRSAPKRQCSIETKCESEVPKRSAKTN